MEHTFRVVFSGSYQGKEEPPDVAQILSDRLALDLDDLPNFEVSPSVQIEVGGQPFFFDYDELGMDDEPDAEDEDL